MDGYVEIEDHKQIHIEQDGMIKAEEKPAEVGSDEDQAPVSAKEAPKPCLLLRSYFARSYGDTRIIQSDLDKISSVICKNWHSRAKQLDMRALYSKLRLNFITYRDMLCCVTSVPKYSIVQSL